MLENTSANLPTEDAGRRLSLDMALQLGPAVAGATDAREDLVSPQVAPSLVGVGSRQRAAEDVPCDTLDRADGWESLTDLQRAIWNVQRAQTLLRLHTLILSDLLREAGSH